jgi:hypothetical protein
MLSESCFKDGNKANAESAVSELIYQPNATMDVQILKVDEQHNRTMQNHEDTDANQSSCQDSSIDDHDSGLPTYEVETDVVVSLDKTKTADAKLI